MFVSGVALLAASTALLLSGDLTSGGPTPGAASEPAGVYAADLVRAFRAEAALGALAPSPTVVVWPTATPVFVPAAAPPSPVGVPPSPALARPAPPQAPVEAPPPPTQPPAPTPTPIPPSPTPIPPSPTPIPSPPVAPAPFVALTAPEQILFDDINAARIQAGLAPLALDARVVAVARSRSADMAANNYFSHTNPQGQTAFDLLTQAGIAYSWAGEHLARNNYPIAEAATVAFNALMASPPHRENILGANYTAIGVGEVTDASGMAYFTMIFIG